MPSNIQTILSRGTLDKAGAAFSWVCAAHCLLLPFLASVSPLIGASFLRNEITEYAFIGVSVVIAAFSLVPGYLREHRKVRTMMLFASGIGLILLADGLFDNHLVAKIGVVAAGAAAITVSHIINRRLCARCRICLKNDSRPLP